MDHFLLIQMLHAIKRRLKKRERREQPVQRESVCLERISSNLSTRAELGAVFDEKLIERENRLGRYIMILGPHEVAPDEPSLLFVYPSCNFNFEHESFKRVAQFCYPVGMNMPVKEDRIIQNQFVFCLNQDSSLLFGVCTHFHLADDNFLSNYKGKNQFCVCTMTPNPQISAIFAFHEFIIHLIRKRYTCLPADIEIPDKPDSWLFDEKDIEKFQSFNPPLAPVADDKLFFSLNSDFVPEVLLSAIRLNFHISTARPLMLSLAPDITIVVTEPASAMYGIAAAAYDILFSALNVDNIVRYVRALMTEQRIIILGNDLTSVSMVALAGMAILSPMSYKGSLLPIIPDLPEILDFLDSPVPFIFGVMNTPNFTQREIPEDVTLINLITGNISYPDVMPHMAGAGELRKTLKNMVSTKEFRAPHDQAFIEFRQKQGLPMLLKKDLFLKYIFSRREIEMTFHVFKRFNEKFVSIDKLAGCRVRDTTDPNNPAVGFVKEAYMIDVSTEDYDFVDMLVATQTFQAYVETSFFT